MNEPQHSNTHMTEYERGKIAVETIGPYGDIEGRVTDLEVRGIVSTRPRHRLEPVEIKFSFPMKLSFESNAWIRSSLRSDPILDIDRVSRRTSHSVEPRMIVKPNIQLEFCPCDVDNVCFDGHVALSYLNSLIKICLSALPGYAKINITYVEIIAAHLALPAPNLEVQYNNANDNLAYVTAQMPPDYFEADQLHGLTVVGTSNIAAENGREADAGFLVHYALNTLLSPLDNDDFFLISVNVTEDLDPEEESKGNYPVMLVLQACKCDSYNLCDEKPILLVSPIVRLCLLSQNSAIVEIVSLSLKQKNGNEQNVSLSLSYFGHVSLKFIFMSILYLTVLK